MRRNNGDALAEPLIPISLVALRCGHLDETIWRKLREGETVSDWDWTYCLPWSRAKQLYDEISGATAAADAENQRRIAEQQDREQFAREYPVRAFKEAAKTRVRGVEVTVPGEPEPPWMHGEGEDSE
jgi:hypothetical protein